MQSSSETIRRWIPQALWRALPDYFGPPDCQKQIRGKDGELYLTRYVLWGKAALGEGGEEPAHSGFLHLIHRPDADRDLHDHPWQWGASLILSGGYTEVRRGTWPSGDLTCKHEKSYKHGDLNVLRRGDYHRIASVEPNTWTLFLCGRVVGDWGFLSDGKHVPHVEYLTERGLL